MYLCSHQRDLLLVLNGCFLQQAIAYLPLMALVEQLKRHEVNQSLQRNFKAILMPVLDFLSQKTYPGEFSRPEVV